MIAHALLMGANPYPQKFDWKDLPWLERMGERLRTSLMGQTLSRSGRLDRFANRVMAMQNDPRITDAALRPALVSVLRAQLRRNGLDDEEAVALCFATVRQLSQELLGMMHYATQIKGGAILLKGFVAEMDTGEGKTLTATLATAAAALSGMQVHIVTVNDYLAARDHEYLTPLYQALGLSTSCIPEGAKPEQKAAAYKADIVFCTNKTVVFDYLRDRLQLGQRMNPLSQQLDAIVAEPGGRGLGTTMRGLQFVIVDEADSVFIDEARTPLILSSARADAAAEAFYRQGIAIARQLTIKQDYTYHPDYRRAELTQAGRDRIKEICAQPEMSVLWRGTRRREETIEQALTGLLAFQLDVHYIIRGGKVMIVDENTGRVMPDRAWEKGLQQLIEVKEGVDISPEKETLARISYQLFFRRYLRLSGMTGTCREVAGELGEAYGLSVVRVQPRKPSLRKKFESSLKATSKARWAAVIEAIEERTRAGQAVLVGTKSILASEHLSRLLAERNIAHQVLNAKQDSEEADLVSRAGEAGAVTIATNMAGRGTDIKLSSEVKQAGGLHVILTERHDNARVDRQLVGRCARQGDPGSWQEILSMEDDLLQNYWPKVTKRLKKSIEQAETSSAAQIIGLFWYRMAQRHEEKRQRQARASLLRFDFQNRKALSFSGQME